MKWSERVLTAHCGRTLETEVHLLVHFNEHVVLVLDFLVALVDFPVDPFSEASFRDGLANIADVFSRELAVIKVRGELAAKQARGKALT
jgi:hypothetical protein